MRCLVPLLLLAAPAQALELALPVDCAIGKDCFIQNYPDHDAGAGRQDYTCGTLSYDGHTGTDIRVPNRSAMLARPVMVLAAAAGIVRGVRDGEPDTGVTGKDDASVKNRECGNGVVVMHGGGYETQYCHLRKGSVRVKAGDKVARGAALGAIGMSGAAQFPHVHFEIRKDGKPLDPFIGTGMDRACEQKNAPLWSADAAKMLGYPAPAFLGAGFSDAPLDPKSEQPSPAHSLSASAPAIIFWAEFMALRRGDEVTLSLHGAKGEVISEHMTQFDRNKATARLFVGKKNRDRLPEGNYLGNYRLVREVNGAKQKLVEGRSEVTVTP